jgi:hypothetical protein
MMYSLLPGHGIERFAPDGKGERFARLFVSTWKRMPLWARRRILAHRRAGCPLHAFSRPLIEVVSAWASQGPTRGLRGVKGMASRRGHKLRFWTEIVDA